MSKASLRASIDSVKGDIERIKLDIATIRSSKKQGCARYAANIKNARDTSTKASYRNQKASFVANCESRIRSKLSYMASKKSTLAQLRVQLKREK